MAPYSPFASGRRSLRSRAWLAAALGSLALAAHACDRVPLLAPSGSAITLSSAAAALSTDSVPVVALVIKGALGASTGAGGAGTTSGGGQPVHDGTVVDFTSTLGTMVPAEVKTVNGKATATWVGNGAVGTVTITATSGAAIKTVTITVTAPPVPAGGGH